MSLFGFTRMFNTFSPIKAITVLRGLTIMGFVKRNNVDCVISKNNIFVKIYILVALVYLEEFVKIINGNERK